MYEPFQDCPYATDACLAVCVAGACGHVLFASSELIAWIPPILQDTTAWMAIVGFLGVVVRAWESHKSYSRTMLECRSRIAARDAEIAELGEKLASTQGLLGRCESLVEICRSCCNHEDCPIRDTGRTRS